MVASPAAFAGAEESPEADEFVEEQVGAISWEVKQFATFGVVNGLETFEELTHPEFIGFFISANGDFFEIGEQIERVGGDGGWRGCPREA